MIEALKQEIPEQLLRNKSIHIRGMGTFYLKIGVRRRKDSKGHWYTPKFTNPDAITARDLCVEGIEFRADPTWNRMLIKEKKTFERAPMRHQVPITKSELLQFIEEYLMQVSIKVIRKLRICIKNKMNKDDLIHSNLI